MKKVFCLLAVATLAFAACNNETSTTSNKMDDKEAKEERNKEIALASAKAIESHNPDSILKNAAPDIEDYGDGSMGTIKGKDSIKAMMQQWFNAFPDAKGEDLKAVADGDLVMVWGTWSGTFKNDLMGMKATGKSFKLQDVDIFKFNDEGQITEHHNVQSNNTMMSQVGAKMPPQKK